MACMSESEKDLNVYGNLQWRYVSGGKYLCRAVTCGRAKKIKVTKAV